jgi:hydroxypyruvate reductase
VLFRETGSPAGREEKAEGKVLRSLFSEAIQGADAYAMVKRAVRLDGPHLRVGNRFLKIDQVREVAFLAAGHAAIPMSSALLAVLGDRVTQGILIAPTPPPAHFPFRHREVTDPLLPSEGSATAALEALELARGLGPHDFLIPLISPGALGMLALPPEGMEVGDYRSLLSSAVEKGLSPSDLLAVVRGLSRAQGGRLAEAAGKTRVEALVVDRGDGGENVGAGPFSLPPPDTGPRARQVLSSLGAWEPMDPRHRAEVLAPPRLDTTFPGQPRTVTVGGPTDALDSMGVEAAKLHHRPTLSDLHDTSGPEASAARLVDAFEEEVGKPREAHSQGLAVMVGITLGAPEGGETSQLLQSFLSEAGRRLKRRGAKVGVLYTGGSIPPRLPDAMGTVDALRAPRMVGMQGGFTDVGTVAVVWYDRS